MIQLPDDFKDFLKLLNDADVEYLLVGGYAVAYHGYPRATGDMDLWIAVNPANADRMVGVLRESGFDASKLSTDLFLAADRIVQLGVPPMRREIHTGVSGLEFADCASRRLTDERAGTPVRIISLADLKRNKQAAGRTKDRNDLEHLP
jgi:hypothetical protein